MPPFPLTKRIKPEKVARHSPVQVDPRNTNLANTNDVIVALLVTCSLLALVRLASPITVRSLIAVKLR